MDEPYYRLTNAEFLLFLNNLINVIQTNIAELPITPAQLDALKARRDSHQTKLNAQVEAEEAAKAATRNLNDERPLGNSDVSYWNNAFKNEKSIPRELIVEMGFKVSEGKTSPPPSEPLNLTVKANANGENDLKWEANSNKQNTIYIVETQADGAEKWEYLASVSALSYTHKNQKPGTQCAYRVKATRKGEESAYSNVAVAYFSG